MITTPLMQEPSRREMTTWLSRWMPTESLGFRKLKSSCLVEPTTDFNTICSFHSSNTGGSVLHPSAASHGHVELVRWINKNMDLAAQTVSRQDDHPIRLKPDPSFQGLTKRFDPQMVGFMNAFRITMRNNLYNRSAKRHYCILRTHHSNFQRLLLRSQE